MHVCMLTVFLPEPCTGTRRDRPAPRCSSHARQSARGGAAAGRAKAVHARRGSTTRTPSSSRSARLATDPEQWARVFLEDAPITIRSALRSGVVRARPAARFDSVRTIRARLGREAQHPGLRDPWCQRPHRVVGRAAHQAPHTTRCCTRLSCAGRTPSHARSGRESGPCMDPSCGTYSSKAAAGSRRTPRERPADCRRIPRILGAAIHGVGGEVLVMRQLSPATLPSSRFGGPRTTKTMIHVTWHMTTIAFLTRRGRAPPRQAPSSTAIQPGRSAWSPPARSPASRRSRSGLGVPIRVPLDRCFAIPARPCSPPSRRWLGGESRSTDTGPSTPPAARRARTVLPGTAPGVRRACPGSPAPPVARSPAS